jgi:RND family efflux transporter MFP subunit
MAQARLRPRLLVMLAAPALTVLAACEQENTYQAPPPPEVTVALPVQQPITRYLEETGNTATVQSVDLVARVQGYLQKIEYKDGATVKKGTPLFVIEPEPFQLKLDQSVASEMGAQASLDQLEAEFKRQSDLASRQFASKATLDSARAARDGAKAKLLQSQADKKQAEINLSYTKVVAPFDGIVTARLVSLGDLVGGSTATKLATIVELNPIYVNFSIGEQEAARLNARRVSRGQSVEDFLGKVPVEVGLQTEDGYPHRGVLDYISPTLDPSTGTLAVRAVFQNPKRVLMPGNFVRVRVPLGENVPSLLVPDASLGSQQGGRYVLVVNGDNVVEQRNVTIGPLSGALRVIDSGLKPGDHVIVDGLQRAIPGQKVAPQMRTASAKAADSKPSGAK